MDGVDPSTDQSEGTGQGQGQGQGEGGSSLWSAEYVPGTGAGARAAAAIDAALGAVLLVFLGVVVYQWRRRGRNMSLAVGGCRSEGPRAAAPAEIAGTGSDERVGERSEMT